MNSFLISRSRQPNTFYPWTSENQFLLPRQARNAQNVDIFQTITDLPLPSRDLTPPGLPKLLNSPNPDLAFISQLRTAKILTDRKLNIKDSSLIKIRHFPDQLIQISPVYEYYTAPSASANLKLEGNNLVLNQVARPSAYTASLNGVEEQEKSKDLLILKPSAFSLAQDKGTAIANPVSRAIVKKGRDVDLIYKPKAFAIAGPGGMALAHSDLILDIIEEQYQQGGQIFTLPFYGGAKGQVLQITRDPNGQILNQVIVPQSANLVPDDTVQIDSNPNQLFQDNLYKIQLSAQRLVELQEKTKRSGHVREEDQKVYAANLALLGQSASTLAQLGVQSQQDLSVLFTNPPKRNKFQAIKSGSKKVPVTHQSQFAEDEEDVGEETDGLDDPSGGIASDPINDEGVQVGGGGEDTDTASVAEAKPVGIAVAGEGGVASSKPVATAVVGPGGLAVARPSATAISGVDPTTVNKIPVASFKFSQDAERKPLVYQYQPLFRYIQQQPQYYPQIF